MTFNNKAKAQEIESPNAVVEAAAVAPAASADPSLSSDDRASLPYGGDLQAAMKAQDRGAIKQIMAFNNKAKAQENESPPTVAALEVAAVTTAAAASADSSASPENASSALPYGGDLQAAMKAQDRSAIKQIMAFNNKAKAQEKESSSAVVEAAAVAPAASADPVLPSDDRASLPYE